MRRSVMCAVDISQPHVETRVLSTAAKLAAIDNAALDIIAVVPDYGMSVVGSFFEADHTEKAVAHARQALNELVDQVLDGDANDDIRHLVATGTAYEEILKAAKAAGSDLIVIGAHKPDFKDYLLGPNAARVVRHADCSVYVVR